MTDETPGTAPGDWHPGARELYAYWASKKPKDGLPGRQQVDPIDIPKLLPRIFLADVIWEGDRPRIRFRLVGQAIVVGVQAHMLHIRQPGGFVRALPPLNAMERLLFQLLGIGFALLSIGLLTGFVYLDDMFAQHLVHKTVLSIVAWCVFGTLLLGRYLWGWRGQRAVSWTLAGLAFLVLAYFGSKFVLELILQRT